MIKVFKHNETDFSHNENVLDDVYFCEVSEELNGQYDVNLEASIIYESILIPECIVTVPTQRGIQPFRIKQVTKTLRGLEAWGQHLFFDLADHFIEDKRPTDATGQGALSTLLEGTGYTGVSNNPTVGTAYYIRKTVVDALLAVDNSYVKVWGGILVRNGKKVTALGEGLDRGYSVRLGENLLGLEYTVDNAGIVTRVYPTAVLDNLVFELPEKQIDAVTIGNYYRPKSRELRVELPESVTTKEDAYPIMRAEAVKFLTAQSVPVLSASFDFIELSKTDEYKGFQILEQLDIGDVVYCDVPTHGIKLSASLVAYVYDSLKDRYISVTVGSVKPSTVSAMSQFKAEIVQEATEIVQSKVTEAINGVSDTIADRITGVNGGNIVIRYTDDGKPYELLVMDTDDVNTATEVIRLNKEGMAFSVNGVNGPFAVAMTAKDGLYAEFIHGLKITADMIEAEAITSDHISAGGIDAGKITVGEAEAKKSLAKALDELSAADQEMLQAAISEAQSIVENTRIAEAVENFNQAKAEYDAALLDNEQTQADVQAKLDALESAQSNLEAERGNLEESIRNLQMTQDDIKRVFATDAMGRPVISSPASSVSMVLDNDRLSIQSNGVELAYFGQDRLYITSGEMKELIIGRYHIYRSDGDGVSVDWI